MYQSFLETVTDVIQMSEQQLRSSLMIEKDCLMTENGPRLHYISHTKVRENPNR